jgi:hypothetical protein
MEQIVVRVRAGAVWRRVNRRFCQIWASDRDVRVQPTTMTAENARARSDRTVGLAPEIDKNVGIGPQEPPTMLLFLP